MDIELQYELEWQEKGFAALQQKYTNYAYCSLDV